MNTKITQFGSLTKAKLARDFCGSMGIVITLEDSWWGDIVTATISLVVHITPTDFSFTSGEFNSYVTKSIVEGTPHRVNGHRAAWTEWGLGILPLMYKLGEPVLSVS